MISSRALPGETATMRASLSARLSSVTGKDAEPHSQSPGADSNDSPRVLSAHEVHDRLCTALTELQRAEQNAVLWFSEIVRRRLYRDLGHSSIHQYAELALGFSKSKTSQFLRLSESLKELPALRRALARGELSWTKAREVAKIATPRTEAAWIREARESPRRVLESRVAETRKRAREEHGPAKTQAVLDIPPPAGPVHSALGRSGPGQSGPGRPVQGDGGAKALGSSPSPGSGDVPLDVNVRMTSEQYARYQALLEALRKQSRKEPQAELLLAGLEQLVLSGDQLGSAGNQGGADEAVLAVEQPVPAGSEARQESAGGSDHDREFTRVNSRSPYQVIVQQCPECGSGSTATNRGTKSLSPQELRTILCDAHRRAPGKRNRAAVPGRVRRAVLQRDRFRCRSAGCGGGSFLAVHHLVPREQGGTNTLENLITLCSGCHRALHARE